MKYRYDNEYTRIFFIMRVFKRQLLNWTILKSEKSTLGVYVVLVMNYFATLMMY